MSSSSGRFQSHLFNFVARQTQKLVDKTTTALRHTKVALIWTTQILLYPVYAVFQSTRLLGQQIGQTVQRALRVTRKGSFLQLTQTTETESELASDTPIQRVLSAIQLTEADKELETEAIQLSFFQRFFQRAISLSYPQGVARFKPHPTSRLSPHASVLTPSPPCPLQGIASLIPTGKLVLVTTDNQIMDILTIEQQESLRQRIIWEMANYWRYCRQSVLNSTASLAIVDRPNSLPPVRIFHQLMSWVQSSPVAIATNLFQESALVEQPSELAWFSPDVSLTFHVAPMPLTVPTTQDFKTLIRQLPTLGDVEALIWAAVHYFFGSRDNSLLSSRYPQRVAPTDADPWLTSSEIFGNTTSALQGETNFQKQSREQTVRSFRPTAHLGAQVSAQEIQPGDSATLALPFQQKAQFGNALQSWIDRFAHKPPRRPSNLAKTKSTRLTSTAKPGKITRRPNASPQPTTPDSDPTLKHTSDWIETKATPVGYVKSPLQRILGWLDRGMVAIESALIAFWRWLTRR
ncbi:hypothetical protein ACKFKF_23145 [Phormidesmis sp. 146-12]